MVGALGGVFLGVNVTAKLEGRMFASRLHQRIEHLVIPAFLPEPLVIDQADLGRELPGDVCAAKDDVPNEEQVAKVTFVMPDAVGI